MAIYSQLAERPGIEIAVKNYGGSDIPEGTGVIWDTTNIDPQLPQGIVIPTAGGAVTPVAGITYEKILAGGIGRLRIQGEKTATAHGAIAMGDFVQISSTSGHVGQVKTVATAGTQLGQARNAAADGDPVVVEIIIAKNA